MASPASCSAAASPRLPSSSAEIPPSLPASYPPTGKAPIPASCVRVAPSDSISPGEQVSRFAFVGDGLYCGDGGAELQRLWSSHAWKPLKNCDGRYVCRDKWLSEHSLESLVDVLRISVSSAVSSRSPQEDGHDQVHVLRLQGGGGILTYTNSRAGRFVHTLNTESGLARKLIALGMLQTLVDTIPGQAGLLFGSIANVLEWIPEPERTKAAPAIAVAMRTLLAHSSI